MLAKRDSPSWDDTTREVVRQRLEEIPARVFLTLDEWNTLSAVCDRLIPQEGRQGIPIAPWIDQQLARNEGDGYRHADMPPLREAWRRGLAAINAESRARYGAPFSALGDGGTADAVLRAIQAGDVRAEEWRGLPADRFFAGTLLKAVVAVYYSHPRAWSEAGFGGPASPRGYVRLGAGERDPWEAVERHDIKNNHGG